MLPSKIVGTGADWEVWADKGMCCYCHQPVKASEPRYTIRECHWDCHEAVQKSNEEFMTRLDESTAKLMKKLKERLGD